MSDKRILDFADLTRLMNDSWNAELDVLFKALPRPTLTDVTGARTLLSLTEEECIEYKNEFMGKSWQSYSKDKVIDHVKLNIACGRVTFREVKWLLNHGFNVFGAEMSMLPTQEQIVSTKLTACKYVLFDMWHSVETGRFDSRSPVGDMALRLRDALYSNEQEFEQEYELIKNRLKAYEERS